MSMLKKIFHIVLFENRDKRANESNQRMNLTIFEHHPNEHQINFDYSPRRTNIFFVDRRKKKSDSNESKNKNISIF